MEQIDHLANAVDVLLELLFYLEELLLVLDLQLIPGLFPSYYQPMDLLNPLKNGPLKVGLFLAELEPLLVQQIIDKSNDFILLFNVMKLPGNLICDKLLNLGDLLNALGLLEHLLLNLLELFTKGFLRVPDLFNQLVDVLLFDLLVFPENNSHNFAAVNLEQRDLDMLSDLSFHIVFLLAPLVNLLFDIFNILTGLQRTLLCKRIWVHCENLLIFYKHVFVQSKVR